MPTRKRNIEIEVLVDDKRAKGQLTGLGDTADKTGGRFTKMGTAVVAGLAYFSGREMLQAVQRLDELNTQMQANEARAEVVFASMTDDVRDWADAQNEAFGIGANALLGLASNVQDLLVPMGFAREDATGMTQEVLTLANALDDWKGGTLGVENATERIIKAMLEEREGLIELGIKITDAEIKSRLLERGQDDLTGSALQQARSLITLELVTEKSADAMAKYTDRAGSAVAVNKELKASTDDTAESLANELAPALNEAKLQLLDVIRILSDTEKATTLTSGYFAEMGQSMLREFRDVAEGAAALFGFLTDIDNWYNQDRRPGLATPGVNLFPWGPSPATSGGGTSGGGSGGLLRHGGGMVPGTPGSDVLVMAQAGEHVTRRADVNGSGGGLTINVNGFVGSELILAQELDRLLTRRHRSSGLGFT